MGGEWRGQPSQKIEVANHGTNEGWNQRKMSFKLNGGIVHNTSSMFENWGGVTTRLYL